MSAEDVEQHERIMSMDDDSMRYKLTIDIGKVYSPNIKGRGITTLKERNSQATASKQATPPRINKVAVQFGPAEDNEEQVSKFDLQGALKGKMEEIVENSPKKKKQKICIDCGGFKPPEESPRTKAKERAMK